VCDAYTRELLPCRNLRDYRRIVGLDIEMSANADVGIAGAVTSTASTNSATKEEKNQLLAFRDRLVAILRDQHRLAPRSTSFGFVSGESHRRREPDRSHDDSFGMLM